MALLFMRVVKCSSAAQWVAEPWLRSAELQAWRVCALVTMRGTVSQMTAVSELRVEARSLQEEGAARSAWVSWTVGSFAIPASKLLSLKYAVNGRKNIISTPGLEPTRDIGHEDHFGNPLF